MSNGKRYQFTKHDINEVRINLKENIFGQQKATENIISILEANRIRTDDNSILGSFLMIGSSGSGKNFTIENIAKALGFGLETIDCSMYYAQELTSLTGTSSGFLGSDRKSMLQELLDKASDNQNNTKRPKLIIHFDELEKARVERKNRNPAAEILISLMNLLDKASVKVKNNNTDLDLSNVLIFMSTNLYKDTYVSGDSKKRLKIGFDTGDNGFEDENEECTESNREERKKKILDNLKRDLGISVFSRIRNNVILFEDIGANVFESIFQKEYTKLITAIKRNISIKFDDFPDYKVYYDEYKDMFDTEISGARQIRQIVQNQIKLRIMKEFLLEKMDDCSSVFMDILHVSRPKYKNMREYDDFETRMKAIPF